jgi:hypothetical protein
MINNADTQTSCKFNPTVLSCQPTISDWAAPGSFPRGKRGLLNIACPWRCGLSRPFSLTPESLMWLDREVLQPIFAHGASWACSSHSGRNESKTDKFDYCSPDAVHDELIAR